jgi:exodeoxyribonuclease III
MRIVTWNINGIRSAIAGDFERWLEATRPDIVCLQETRIPFAAADALAFRGYRTHWHCANRNGYSGVALLIRTSLVAEHVELGVGVPAIDAEGRILAAKLEHFTLINIYAPHSHRQLTRLAYKISFFDSMLDLLERKYGNVGPVVLAGDFNVAHTDLDLANYRQNKGNAGCLPEERSCLDRLCALGYNDAFRSICSDSGHYTWWSQREGVRERNIGWRLDYFFITHDLRPKLQKCFHSSEVRGSDHCPVVLDLTVER